MGKALLGHKVGDRVAVTPEKGDTFYVVIRSIENTVDESDNWIN
jgi:transcription elongation GreA/GreB family factor